MLTCTISPSKSPKPLANSSPESSRSSPNSTKNQRSSSPSSPAISPAVPKSNSATTAPGTTSSSVPSPTITTTVINSATSPKNAPTKNTATNFLPNPSLFSAIPRTISLAHAPSAPRRSLSPPEHLPEPNSPSISQTFSSTI